METPSGIEQIETPIEERREANRDLRAGEYKGQSTFPTHPKIRDAEARPLRFHGSNYPAKEIRATQANRKRKYRKVYRIKQPRHRFKPIMNAKNKTTTQPNPGQQE